MLLGTYTTIHHEMLLQQVQVEYDRIINKCRCVRLCAIFSIIYAVENDALMTLFLIMEFQRVNLYRLYVSTSVGVPQEMITIH